uniref:Putative secreted protein n=1 Tax=Anopheles marajoara TaxID=58244 RepID=A0A2M4CA91_9DIPT
MYTASARALFFLCLLTSSCAALEPKQQLLAVSGFPDDAPPGRLEDILFHIFPTLADEGMLCLFTCFYNNAKFPYRNLRTTAPSLPHLFTVS